ncbi:TetR family transcriptional regulator [Kibdelosporangium phytohabitans]|uniref:TetR family transcriptional regulator n=1 Tax=Kibdelosporangium phytohabitans TaxID=860235 RepID=A0A0N7F547_9PSEU|nr:TetR/AcrR family transcriptional regulator [Kibdelosporangium phytohabitans]ALG13223.1 TetR family transcriptional regulator [Kibdelosporangium phytohabitans]
MRTDAAANRAKILDTARAVFAAEGLDVPMSEIARRAGLGVATLYRRFPTKEDLVAEAFAEQMTECAGMLDAALADPDPWRAFCRVVQEVCAMQARDRGFAKAFVTAFPHAPDFRAQREHAERGLTELVSRAQEAGALRRDFHMADVALVLQANGGIRAGTPEETAQASRRLVAYLLQSFRADSAAPLPRSVAIPFEAALP